MFKYVKVISKAKVILLKKKKKKSEVPEKQLSSEAGKPCD